MKIQDFVDYLKEHPEGYNFYLGKHREKTGFFVMNKGFSTLTHFTNEADLEYDLPFLFTQTRQGKNNVDHITRITGYFGRTTHWNKGKKAELRDRARLSKRL